MLHIIQSNNVEHLLHLALGQINQHSDNVFAEQHIIVSSHGMGMWLKLAQAKHTGIAVGLRTHLWGAYRWRLYRAVLGPQAVEALPQLNEKTMAWQIYTVLQQQNDIPSSPLHDLIKHKDSAALWTIATETAKCLHTYMLYRPDWLQAWQKGNAIADIASQCAASKQAQAISIEGWQRYLWQLLFADAYAARQALQQQFWQTLNNNNHKASRLPKQLFLFCPQQLSPSELAFIHQLAGFTTIYFYHFNPSQEYWADVVDPKWLENQSKRRSIGQARTSEHFLLSRFYKSARDFFGLLIAGDSADAPAVWADHFVPQAHANTLLAQLQNDVLQLQHSDLQNHKSDNSIAFISAANLDAQISVVHHRLRHWLDSTPGASPADVLILTPNLEQVAAHWCLNVPKSPSNQLGEFGANPLYIPYYVQGSGESTAAQIVDVLTLLQQTLKGRAYRHQLLAVLMHPLVRGVLGITLDDAHAMDALWANLSIYRGIDSQHLAKTTQLEDNDQRFTLAYGLQRLALGLVMPEQADSIATHFAGINPSNSDGELGQKAMVVMRQLLSMLQGWQALSELTQPLAGWLDALSAYVNTHFGAAPDMAEAYNQWLQLLQQLQQLAPSTIPIDINTLLSIIAQQAQNPSSRVNPTGAVTITRLGSVRLVPYKLIILFDMSESMLQAHKVAMPFNLCELMTRRGDRSNSGDALGAFVEPFLLAQTAVWVSNQGVNKQGNPVIACKAVEELKEWLTTKAPDEAPKAHYSLYAYGNPWYSSIGMGALANDGAFYKYQDGFDIRPNNGAKPPLPTLAPINWNAPLPEALPAMQFNAFFSSIYDPAKAYCKAKDLYAPMLEEQNLLSLEPLSLTPLQHYELKRQLFNAEQGLLKNLSLQNLTDTPVHTGKISQDAAEKDLQTMIDDLEKLLPSAEVTATRNGYVPIMAEDNQPPLMGIYTQLPQVSQTRSPYAHTWVRLIAEKAVNDKEIKSKKLLKIWLQHLLWQSVRTDNGEQGSSELAGCTVVQYIDTSLVLPAVTPLQARQWLRDYARLSNYSGSQLVLWQPDVAWQWALMLENGEDTARASMLALWHQAPNNQDQVDLRTQAQHQQYLPWQLLLAAKQSPGQQQQIDKVLKHNIQLLHPLLIKPMLMAYKLGQATLSAIGEVANAD